MTITLINGGADVNMVNNEGKTALMEAARWGRNEIALALINDGADVNLADKEDETALMKAAFVGRNEIALALINGGADVNMADNKGKTALMEAARLRENEIALALINGGADVNMVDKEGKTALMRAAFVERNEIIIITLALINGGADVNTVDKEGKTALMRAASLGRNESAHVNMTDFKGNTALKYGIKNKDVVSALISRGNAVVNNPDCFYPDVSEDPTTFWKTVIDMGFDLWVCDKDGDSVISNLIESEAFVLAKALVEVACDARYNKSVEALVGVLNAICKDKSTRTTWKNILVEAVLKSRLRLFDVSASLRLCMLYQHQSSRSKRFIWPCFAGINEKDGMEVAIKRIEKLRMVRPEDKREIRSFTALPDCKQILRYLAFFESEDFSYVILELMEGNLDEYFGSAFFDSKQNTILCKDVVMGLKYLHDQNIIHRDLKPSNILYKTHPKLCLKITDFGLSRRLDINPSFTVMSTGVGTRGWIAPEVVKGTSTNKHSMSPDTFSCGLLLHYILSAQKHPFNPADCSGKSIWQINTETESNLLSNSMEGWNSSLAPEDSDLIQTMLDSDENQRPSASQALDHPMFWSKKKKLNILSAVGNQPEFECPRAIKTTFLTAVEIELEMSFPNIVKYATWDDPRYVQMPAIFTEMTQPVVKTTRKGKIYTTPPRKYDTGSAVELVRFIRNAIAHVSDASRPSPIRKQILEDAVFLDDFPNLFMEVLPWVPEALGAEEWGPGGI
ncbi:hypothetical protein QZH41_013809, partial [Actinostola sp. cb2023]